MREIDERVVEMRFKNSNFEKNAKHTIGVLDELEKKIAFPKAKKNIEGLEKEFSKISFGALEKGIETVTLKFSALQIAGITAIQNITNKAINAGEALVKSLSIDQITAGFTKYEQKTTSVQTIVSATGKTVEEVNRALDKLNWFTDETSYNFVDMVNNIGKFTAAGVDLEDAMSAMIGIANEAAVSGQNASAASHAMMNFSQALGSGAVKLQDWKSIQTVNMDTIEFKQAIIDTAVEFGTLQKVAEDTYAVVGEKDKFVDAINFTNELKTGWFTSDVLVESLKKYSDYAEQIYEITQKEGISASEAMERFSNDIETLGEKAFKAGQVSKTFTDAVEATKDAVSTQWMKTFEMIVGDLDQASETWTELTGYLWEFFAEDLENMNDALKPVLGEDPYSKLIEELKEAGVAEDQFGEIVKKNAKKYGIAIDEIIEREGSLGATIRKYGWGSIIRESIDDLAEGAEVTSTKVVDLTDKFEEYQKVVNDVIRGNYKNGIEARTKALAEAGYEFSIIQPLVNKQLEKGAITADDLKEVLGDLTEEELKNIGITKEQAESLKELSNSLTKKTGRELIIDSFRNALKGVQKVLSTVKEAWNEIFPPKTQEEIYAIIEKFHDFSKNLILNEENADKLKRSLKGVFAALDIVKQIVGGAFKTGLTVLGKLFGKTGLDVGEMSASLGDSIVALRNWLNEGNKIGLFFESLTYSILHAKEYIQGWFDSFMEAHPNFSKWFDGLKDAFENFKLATKDKWGSIIEDIKSGKIKDALATVATYFLEFRDTVISYLTGIDFNSFVKETNAAGFGKAKNILEDLKGAFFGIVEGIKNAAITAGGWVKTFINSLNPMWFIPVMFAGAIIAIHEISKELATLTKLLRPLEDIKKAFISTLDTVGKSAKKWFDAMTLEQRSAAIINFAVAIGLFAGSCWVLAQVPWTSMWRAIGGIVVLTGVLVGANQALVKWGKQGKGLARLASVANALSGFVLIMVAAIKVLETVNTEKIDSIFWPILAIFLGVSVFIKALSKLNGELPKVTGALIGLSIVVGMISSTFLVLGLVPAEGLLIKVISIGLVLAELLGVIAIMSVIQKKWKTAAKRTVSSLIGVVLALDLLAVSLKLIETVKVKDILMHLGSFIAVFVMLDVLAKIASKVGAGSGGSQILALAAGLLILVPAINSFSDIKFWGLAKAVIAVGILLKLEQMIINSSFASGQNSVKAGAMVLMVSAAVAALSLVVWGFSALDFGGLAQGTVAIGIILWIITQMIYASEKAEGGMGKMIALTAMVGIVSTAIIILANMNTDSALKAAASLSLVFLSVIGAMKLLENVDGMNWKAMGQMAILAVVGFPLIANVLEALNEIKTEGIIERATALSVGLLALSAASVILIKFGKDVDEKSLKMTWVTMAVLSGVLVVLAAIGVALNHFKVDPKTMLKQFIALSAGILMLEVCVAGMIGLAKLVEVAGGATTILAAMKDVGLIMAAVGGIAFVLSLIFGAIEEFTSMSGYSMNGLLENGVKTMTLIGNAIGSMIGGLLGGIVGGAGEGFMSHLEAMGTYLSKFGKAVEPFLNLMSNEKFNDIGQNISMLTGAILDLTKAEFLQNMNDFIAFLNPVTAFNKGKEIASGETPFDKLGKGLEDFADSMVAVADKFEDMKQRGVIGSLLVAVSVSKQLTELLNAIPSQSVFEDFFKGEIKWTNLSDGLVDYGKAVNMYALQALALNSGNRVEAIKASIPVAEDLNDLLDKIPKVSVWSTIFDGTSKWSTLSEGLEDFGNALLHYGLKTYAARNLFTHIVASKDAVKALAEMEDAVPKVGGVLSEFVGNKDWSALSTGLEDLGDGLISFGNKAKELKDSENLSVVQATVPLLDKFVDTVNDFTNITGLGTINDVAINAATILGNMVGAFGDEVGGTDIQNKVKKGLTAANDMYEFAKTVASSYLIGTEMTTLGKDISGYASEIAAAAKTLRSIDNEDFYEIAKYAISGYSNGIYTGQAVVKESVAKAMVDTTLNTLEGGLEINSPSWKTFVDGLFTAEGFGGGLEQGKKYITDAVSGWGQEVLSGINLDSILDQFSEFGVDLTKVLPDISSLGGDFGTDLTFNYEKQIAEMKTNISQLTKDLGKDSDEVINAQLELDKLQDEYKDYTKSRTSNLEYYENKEYSEAQKQFDKLLEDYKAGRKTQMEFDTEYTQLLQKNTVKQAELFQYSAQKIQEYVSDSLGKVQDEFETTISNIQSKMDSTIDTWDKSFDDQFKFTTRQDLFDEEISKYDKDIEQLNTQIEKEKRLHGEDSIVVQKLQKDLERVKKTREEINEQWNEYDEDYKNQIVSVDMTGEWEKQAERAKKSLEAVDSLKGRLSDEMIDWLGTLDPETLYAVATDWASKTDEELQVIMNKYLDMKNANVNLANALYGPEIQAAEEKFMYDYTNTLNKLPDTAKAIGASIVQNMTNSFSEETNKTLQTFKESGDNLIFAIKQGLGFTEDGSKSKKMEETGEDMSNGVGDGFVKNQPILREVFADTLGNSLYEAVNDVDYDGIARYIGNGLYEALGNIDADSSVSISPVISSSTSGTLSPKRNLNSGRSATIARETGTSFNQRYETGTDNKPETTDSVPKTTSFVQNIYSPDPVNRSAIRRDTKQLFQLANSKFK